MSLREVLRGILVDMGQMASVPCRCDKSITKGRLVRMSAIEILKNESSKRRIAVCRSCEALTIFIWHKNIF
jgi:hypothetical protein